MAGRPGEENVATLHGDIHYFYGPPDAKPPHHRFDKGSYVYLFENANDRRARLEIANHAGTDDQDAFDGFLDHTRVQYSYNHQCLVSIAVDGVPGAPVDQNQWHLPTFDPHNQNKYHYRLYSLDIYFWTQKDALKFVNGIRRVLPAAQVEVADEPPPPAHHAYAPPSDVNPLVQKLENAAISNSQSGGGQAVPSFAPPPVSADTPGTASSHASASFQPIAYNPAAPAAPEQIQHREKTPPPEDDGHDPLAAAVASDHGVPPTPGYPPQTLPGPPPPPTPGHPGVTSPGFAPGTPGHPVMSPGFPPTQFGQPQPQRTASVPQAGVASPGLASPYGAQFPGSPGLPPPQHAQSLHHHQQVASPGLPPPHHLQQQQQLHHPQVASPGLPPQHAQQQPLQSQPSGHSASPQVASPGLPPPPGGFGQFNYSQQSLPHQQQPPPESIHQQVYRPTEVEHKNKYGGHEYKTSADGRPSKLGENAQRLEKGVTGMLKRFEKKFG